MSKTCPSCIEEFKSVGCHWDRSDCEYPELSSKQKQIAIGLIMGDGHIDQTSKPCIIVNMITKEYLEYVDDEFGILGNGVKHSREAYDNRQDVYRWTTVRHPYFNKLASWYNTGEKVFPDDIEITPTVLKHWYCGDGCWKGKGSGSNLEIAMANESENTEKISTLFTTADLPTPNYKSYEDESGSMCTAYFSASDSPELFDFMGEPLPGFDYKWPSGE